MGNSIIKINNNTGVPDEVHWRKPPLIHGEVNPARAPADIMNGSSGHIEIRETNSQHGTEGAFNYRIENFGGKELSFVKVEYLCRGDIQTCATLEAPDFHVATAPDDNAQGHQVELKVHFTVT